MHPSFIAAAPTHWGRVGRVVDARDFDQTEHQWRFPIHGGTPVHHPLDNGIFHEIIHPAIGVPPWLRKPPYIGVTEDEVAVYPKNVHFRRDMLPSFSGKPIWGHNLWPRDCRFCLLHVSDKRSYFSVRTSLTHIHRKVLSKSMYQSPKGRDIWYPLVTSCFSTLAIGGIAQSWSMGIKLVIIHKQNGIIMAWKNCMEKYRGTSSARVFFLADDQKNWMVSDPMTCHGIRKVPQ